MNIKKIILFSFIIANLGYNLQAGTGAGIAGGLIGGTVLGTAIAANSRHNDVVYVDHDHHYNRKRHHQLNLRENELDER